MPKSTPTSTRTRRAASRPTARPPRPRRQRRNDGLIRDVFSIALIALGLSGLTFLWVPGGAGTLGREAAALLRAFAGAGSFVIPLGLLVVGGLLLRDPEKVGLNDVTAGIAILFLAYVSTLHVHGVVPGILTDPELRSACGGWLGEMIGGSLRGWVGNPVAYIILLAVGVLALLLILDRPLPELLGYAGQAASGTAARVKAARGVRAPAATGAEPGPSRKGSAFLDLGAGTDAVPPTDAPAKTNGKKRGKEKDAVEDVGLPGVSVLAPEPAVDPAELPKMVAWHSPEEPALPEEPPAPEPVNGKAKRKAKVPVEAEAETVAPETGDDPAAPPAQDLKEYVPPPTGLLEYAQVLPEGPGATTDTARNIRILEETLAEFKIQAKVMEIAKGPAFTRYEIRLAPGIRVNRIESLGDNIAMNLAALDVRIQAPIPGKTAIGIEVPNKATSMVSLREVVESSEFQEAPSRLTFALGKDVTGRAWTADLTRMPHLLIGGATNSGKSVCLNCLIASILVRARPDEVKLLLIDPKRVELSLFDGIPHLLYPVVTDIRKAAGMLNWAIREMERRYDLFVKVGSRDINSYNQRAAQGEDIERIPYIIIVVDELADLMMQVAAEVEHAICRLAQLARATGIHLVIATQRPSVDVITGLIKANISSRIAFAVSSHIDSRTILDKRGAERLLGRGDMLFDPIGASKPMRIQGAYISEKEVETLVEYLSRQAAPVYTAEPVDASSGGGAGGAAMDSSDDDLFEDAVRYIVTTRRASTSTLQRKFAIGYTRAARLIDMMEERGIVSALDGSKPREVLIGREQMEQFFASPLAGPPPSLPAGEGEDDSLE